MKFSKKLLVGLMAVALAGGVASTLALTATVANTSTNGNVDQAIYLNWNESSCSISDATLSRQMQYRQVAVEAPQKSASVTKIGQLTFTLAADTGKVIDGITVYISKNAIEGRSDDADRSDIITLNSVNTTTSYNFEEATIFYIGLQKVNDEHADNAGAILTMSLSVVDKK